MESNIIGRFAISNAGHDKGTLYVIVAKDEGISSVIDKDMQHTDIVRGKGFVYLCDGNYHTLEKPKKKSLKHVNLCKASVEEELRKRIMEKDKLFNHEIKYVIKQHSKGKEEGHVKE